MAAHLAGSASDATDWSKFLSDALTRRALTPDTTLAVQHPGRCLARIEQLVDQLFCEPATVGALFGSPELDDLCQRVGRDNLARLGLVAPPAAPSATAELPTTALPTTALPTTIFIASRLHASGGHSAALIDMIRLAPPARVVIVVTEVCGRSDRVGLARRLAGMTAVEVVYVPPGGHLAKLSWLQTFLHQRAPQAVWLFNHHQDSVAVAAVQPDRGYQLHFYHHGDDRLCLGVCLGYGRHYDITPMTFHVCRALMRGADQRYLPLVVPDLGANVRPDLADAADAVDAATARRGPLVTCTAAGYNKVEVDYVVSYLDVIPAVLRRTGGRHIHIGRLSWRGRRRLRAGLRRAGVDVAALTYIPWVPSVWLALRAHQVDLYLASFPYGGGRTLVEVMGAGVPAIVHRHVTQRMIGGFDMMVDGACSWRSVDELLTLLDRCTPAFLAEQGRAARAWYENTHRDAIVAAALAMPGVPCPAPQLKPGYAPDTDLMAGQGQRRIGVAGWCQRAALRWARRLRSVIGRRSF